ncbi:hypothetical protein D3C72_1897960 [compost metagenome]
MTSSAIDLGPDGGQQVHRQHVHEVHQEDPDKHRETQRSNELAALGVVDIGLGLVVHHLDQHFHRRLEATGHTGGCLTGS